MRQRFITAVMAAALLSVAAYSALAGGGVGMASSPTAHGLMGTPATPTAPENTMLSVADQIEAAQAGLGADSIEERRRINLRIYRFATELAQLAADFGR